MSDILRQPEGGLLQSPCWADFVRSSGKKVIEFADSGFGIVNTLPVVGSYLYIPRILHKQTQNINDIITLAQHNKYGWIRCDIANKFMLRNLQDFAQKHNVSVTTAPHNMQPQTHLIIDLTLSDDELLAHMKAKTRYNIRLAQKKGVVVKLYTTKQKKELQSALEIFCQMIAQTANRKGVNFHPAAHYHQMFANIPATNIMLYTAEYQDEVIAANIVTRYGGVATYLHGATGDAYRNVMAPFLLQWRAICDARDAECAYYDFGGVFLDSTDAGKQGITRFKTGFSPKEKLTNTAGTYDIILSPWRYQAYKILQQIKNKL